MLVLVSTRARFKGSLSPPSLRRSLCLFFFRRSFVFFVFNSDVLSSEHPLEVFHLFFICLSFSFIRPLFVFHLSFVFIIFHYVLFTEHEKFQKKIENPKISKKKGICFPLFSLLPVFSVFPFFLFFLFFPLCG